MRRTHPQRLAEGCVAVVDADAAVVVVADAAADVVNLESMIDASMNVHRPKPFLHLLLLLNVAP